MNENKFYLMISDNGIGIPDRIDLKNANTFGMQLINYLTQQLKGTIEIDRSHGTKFKLLFNELNYKDRVISNG